jgi:alpha-maltose-1-phosphate synthase
VEIQVHCFGEPRPDAIHYATPDFASAFNPASQALAVNLQMSEALTDAEVVHSHTWYSNMAGHWASLAHKIPHIITAHSLEPRRPWKEEQLGGGYRLSSWAERTAYHSASAVIAVSNGMRDDILTVYPDIDPTRVHTVRNGVDTDIFAPRLDNDVYARLGIPAESPYAIFVGRITRQKGIAHLLRAWRDVPRDIGLIVAASSPDEPAIGAEVESLIHELQATRPNVVWIKEMLPIHDLTVLLTGARVALCPSIYEPLGIVNLEAMACGTAVIASEVGGIPEVVDHQRTGELVPYDGDGPDFEGLFAQAISRIAPNEDLCRTYGDAGRARAISEFGWDAVALATLDVYRFAQLGMHRFAQGV